MKIRLFHNTWLLTNSAKISFSRKRRTSRNFFPILTLVQNRSGRTTGNLLPAKKETIMLSDILNKPQAPWMNSLLEREGIYEAEIMKVSRGFYGEEDNEYVQILLLLSQEDVYLATNIYVKNGPSKSQHRLYYFCACVDMVPADILHDPNGFEGKRLNVEISTMMNSRSGKQYSDVSQFLPAEEKEDNSCIDE